MITIITFFVTSLRASGESRAGLAVLPKGPAMRVTCETIMTESIFLFMRKNGQSENVAMSILEILKILKHLKTSVSHKLLKTSQSRHLKISNSNSKCLNLKTSQSQLVSFSFTFVWCLTWRGVRMASAALRVHSTSSFCFILFRFVSFCFILFHFAPFGFIWFHLVSFGLVSDLAGSEDGERSP
jgi:hypothetical protein